MMTLARAGAALIALALLTAAGEPVRDDASRFGAREGLEDLSLSPDGKTLAFVNPGIGQGGLLHTLGLEPGASPKRILIADGNPERLGGCSWVSNQRLVCSVYGVVRSMNELLPFTRVVAVDADGANLKLLSTRDTAYSRGIQLGGGNVIDWLPDEDGTVLMGRTYLPDDRTGSHVGMAEGGFAVDRLDSADRAAMATPGFSRTAYNPGRSRSATCSMPGAGW